MLSDSLKTLLATSYAFVIKVQNFHWNVEGSNFPQYHTFFEHFALCIHNCVSVEPEVFQSVSRGLVCTRP